MKKTEREADRYVDPNETKLQKIKRYLGYYKIPIIAVLGIAIVLSVMTFTLVDKTKVDMYVFFVCDEEYGFLPADRQYLEFFSDMNDFVKGYVDDYNGDGEINLGIDTIYLNSTDEYRSDIASNRQRVRNALASGTCMCVIADTAGFEYLASTGLLQDISYLVDDTYFDGKAYRLNDSEVASAAMGLDNAGPLYIGLRAYYGTYAQIQKKQTAYFTMAEKMLKMISDPDFDPETDAVPTPED